MTTDLKVIDVIALIIPVLIAVGSVYGLWDYIVRRKAMVSPIRKDELNDLDVLIDNIRNKKITVNNKELIAALDKYFSEYNNEATEPLNQIRRLEKKKLVLIYKYFLTRNLDKGAIKSLEKEIDQEYDLSRELVGKLLEGKLQPA